MKDTTLYNIQFHLEELLAVLEQQADELKAERMEVWSNVFKKRHNIDTDYHVLVVHYYVDAVLYADEYTDLEFFDEEWRQVDDYSLWNRYSDVEKHKYSHIPWNDFVSSDNKPPIMKRKETT